MKILERIRKGEDDVLVLGNHERIVQSVLDFDFLCGKKEPSVVAIVTANRTAQKFFFGVREILIPCYPSVSAVPPERAKRVRWFLNLQSGRRAFDSTVAFFDTFPDALGGHIFAENVPEKHATELIRRFGRKMLIAGPSGVGILVGGHFKLGAIGGISPAQIEQGKLASAGSVAVVSTSGGMTNELITAIAAARRRVSFSVSIGGDRFPVASLTDVITLAQNDAGTAAIVYFGELGGSDEYEIVELIEKKKLTKPLVAYVAGVIDEAFDEHVQFGHAKALVARKDESARAKREALRACGAIAPETFPAFLEAVRALPAAPLHDRLTDIAAMENRRKSILSTRAIVNLDEVPIFIERGKLARRGENSFARAALRALLCREVSDLTAAFTENIFELLIDHGGHVSGAVTTMITARAGKDLVSSLAAGLLSVGPRFGGAVNAAAALWREGVMSSAKDGKSAADFVAEKTKGGRLLAGIGHRAYRVGLPDPRVAALSRFAALLKKHPHWDFARAVEEVTTGKSGNLILNVDGAIAALFLDLLAEKEGMSDSELAELIGAEFFNALFVIPRSVGFIAHFMEQKKNDEGLFRLPEELLFVRNGEKKGAKKR